MVEFSNANRITAPILEQLSPPVRKCLLSRSKSRIFERGETIGVQDEPCTCLKIVLSGWVKLYRVTSSGHEALLAMLSEGQSFDEVQALSGGRTTANVEAATNCKILFVDLSALVSRDGASREISSAILSAAAGHLDNMMLQVEELKVHTGVERLSNFLIRLIEQKGGATQVQLPFDKVVLASALGMKPESLSRAFSRLRNFGVRSEQKSIVVNDLNRLRELVEKKTPRSSGRLSFDDQPSIASNSSMKPEIIDRPLSQNCGSLASSPNGANSSLWCIEPPARSMSKYLSSNPSAPLS